MIELNPTTILWACVGLVGIVCSAMFSGLEIGLYSLNRVKLHLLAQQGQRSAITLTRLLRNRSAMIATLLIANNLANNLSSSATSIVLESGTLTPWQVIGVSCLVITPVLFVFGETLPKDLFAAHADRLIYPFSRLLWVLRWGLTVTGLLPLVLLVSELPMKLLGKGQARVDFHPRHEMHMLMREGVGYGLLSDEQSAIVQRVMDLGGRTVAGEMVPWKKVIRVHHGQDVASLWKLAEQSSVSRFPMVDAAGKVLGVVSLYDALRHEQADCPPPMELLKPAVFLDAATPVRTALATLRDHPGTLGIVTERHKPIGIVTLKDLIEPITGDLSSW